MATTSRTHGVDSARKVLQILTMFDEETEELALGDIGRHLGSSTSSSYRYLALLKELGFVEERGRGAYVLTPRVIAMARAAERSLDLGRAARPALVALASATGETALILRRVNLSAVCVERIQPDTTIRLSFAPGSSMPLHMGASSKVLLAALDAERRSMYLDELDGPLSRSARAALERELAEIARTGRAESHAEVDAGIWAFARPVAVAGDIVAAVTVACPDFRVDEAKRARIRDEVTVAADAVSARLGLAD